MTTATTASEPTAWERLREPFPPEKVDQLRRKQKQPDGSYKEIDLDYVGHAHVTDRLLAVDPLWQWEPMATTDDGLPLFTRNEKGEPVGLWIRLTVGGHTRLGFGSVAGGAFDAEKQLIGDALRNAAMRFGVALDLWTKEEAKTTAPRDGQAKQSGGDRSQRRTTRSVPIEGRACPECGDQLAMVYRDTGGPFIGHIPYRKDGCKWRPDPETDRALRDAAPPDPDPLNPPAPADDPVATRILASITDLPEEQRRAIFTDERWAREHGETAKAWIARLNAATRLMLTGEIGRVRTHPAPESEAPSSVPSQNGAPAPSSTEHQGALL